MVEAEAGAAVAVAATTAEAPPLVLPLPLPLAAVFSLHLGLPGTDPSASIATLKRCRRGA